MEKLFIFLVVLGSVGCQTTPSLNEKSNEKICNGKVYKYKMSVKDPTYTQLFLDPKYHSEKSITFFNNECQ